MKKNKKKEESSNSQSMQPAQIKKFQKMLADIGSRKVDGFVYMAMIPKKKDKNVGGVIFLNQVSKATVVGNLIEKLEIHPATVIQVALGIK